jgi:hypothetical protein
MPLPKKDILLSSLKSSTDETGSIVMSQYEQTIRRKAEARFNRDLGIAARAAFAKVAKTHPGLTKIRFKHQGTVYAGTKTAFNIQIYSSEHGLLTCIVPLVLSPDETERQTIQKRKERLEERERLERQQTSPKPTSRIVSFRAA